MIIYKCPRAQLPSLQSRKRLNLYLMLINNKALRNMLSRKLKLDLLALSPTVRNNGRNSKLRRRTATSGKCGRPTPPKIPIFNLFPSSSPFSHPLTHTTPIPPQICILTRSRCPTKDNYDICLQTSPNQ